MSMAWVGTARQSRGSPEPVCLAAVSVAALAYEIGAATGVEGTDGDAKFFRDCVAGAVIGVEGGAGRVAAAASACTCWRMPLNLVLRDPTLAATMPLAMVSRSFRSVGLTARGLGLRITAP